MPRTVTKTAQGFPRTQPSQKNRQSGTPARIDGFFVGFGVVFGSFFELPKTKAFFASGGVAPLATPVYGNRDVENCLFFPSAPIVIHKALDTPANGKNRGH